MRAKLYVGLALALGGAIALYALAPRRQSPVPAEPPRAERPTLSQVAHAAAGSIATRFAPPSGFARVAQAPDAFGSMLRGLPLKPVDAPVRLHTGALKARQDVHAAVVDLDVGRADLQQCADVLMRLRAEHLYGTGRMDEIAFHFTSGDLCAFSEWRQGTRWQVAGSHVTKVSGGPVDASHASMRRYLELVFTYAGTASLPRDTEPVSAGAPLRPGDVFLQPGSPGHAMIVVEVAERGTEQVMLIAQGYMPAQDIHVVKNPGARDGSPWFRVGAGAKLVTPEWSFPWSAVRRFRDAR
jgi:hypothetical protein